MSANPLVSALAAFSQGEMQGREKKQKRDDLAMQQAQQAEALNYNRQRQGALDALDARLKGAQIVNYESEAATRGQERFGDFETAVDEQGNPILVQRGDKNTIKRTGLKPYQPPRDDRALIETARHNKAMEGLAAQRAERAAAAQAKPPTANVQQEYFSHRTLRDAAKKALAALDANPDAVGMMKGIGMALPGTPTNRKALGAEDEKIRTRNILSDIGSLKIRERSGAAVTAAEAPRFKPFVPTIGGDYQFNRRALLELIARAEDTMNAADDEYGGFFSARHGGKPSGGGRVLPNPRD